MDKLVVKNQEFDTAIDLRVEQILSGRKQALKKINTKNTKDNLNHL